MAINPDKALSLIPGEAPYLETQSLAEQKADTRVVYGALSDRYFLMVGESLEERDEIMGILSAAFLLVFVIAIPLVLLLVWLLTRQAIRGIQRGGSGIAPEHQNNIFNRFFRIDPSRTHNGSGLGLSYARAVARSHGGDITVHSDDNKDTSFTITLPQRFQSSTLAGLEAVPA